MNKINVLDCTLRDGGYVNNWHFGFNNIKDVVGNLVLSNVDIIECGFLSNKITYDPDNSRFDTMKNVAKIIPPKRNEKMFVCLINYGEYELEDIPEYDGSSLDGLRVAFHKEDLDMALEFCQGIKDKGYKLFLQPMVSLSYSDEEFLNLIRQTCKLRPYAFYIVDSFGVMKRKDMIRLYYMVEHNMVDDIYIGYHSHNNLQLSYSNAQALVDIKTTRNLIIDSSVFGMGRGAGNLNTELFIEYLNDNFNGQYNIKPLLRIIDEVLSKIYFTNYWGYSLPHYLSAVHNCHPNYASYLDEKKTLTVDNIDEILFMLPENKKCVFNKDYIDMLYISYLGIEKDFDKNLIEFKKNIKGKTIVLIAPGKSVKDEKEKVIAECKNSICISVNFDYKYLKTDYIFLSNLRRYRELAPEKRKKMIVTSNIPTEDIYLKIKYTELLNEIESVEDNATMMLIKFLINMGVEKLRIAGLDGYSHDLMQNFADQEMAFITKNERFDIINKGLSMVLKRYEKLIKIDYITRPRFITIS